MCVEFRNVYVWIADTAIGDKGAYPDFTFQDIYWAIEDCASVIFTILFDEDDDRPALMDKKFYQLIRHYFAEDPNFDTQALEAKKITRKDGASPNYLKFLPSLS
ncbi:hypothetical protein CE91St43_04570 [Oscillospiraceae bacterium]|nr:hypothetical protein CE91St43_04570 [Oscillospiraceae bacterium]